MEILFNDLEMDKKKIFDTNWEVNEKQQQFTTFLLICRNDIELESFLVIFQVLRHFLAMLL